MTAIPPILLVGCGRMGGAMLAGWRERGLAPSIAVDPAPEAARMAGPDLTVVADASIIPADFSPAAVVLAVKPQTAADALPPHARHAGRAVFLSIMAGRTIGGISGLLGPDAAVVRAMPNTPAAVRQGVTVACAGPGVTTPQRTLCDRLLQAIGVVAWADDEALLDPVTAVSGSGPAYVFLLAELHGARGGGARNSGGAGAAAGAPDGCRLGRAAGRQHGRCRRAAPRRHQPRRHDGGGAEGADGAGCLACRDEPRHRRGDPAVARAGRVGALPPPAARRSAGARPAPAGCVRSARQLSLASGVIVS